MGEFKFFGWHAEDSLRQATPLFSLLWTNSAVSTGSHYLQPSLSNLFFTSCQSDLSRTYLDHITSLFKTFPGFLFGPKLKSWASNRLARLVHTALTNGSSLTSPLPTTTCLKPWETTVSSSEVAHSLLPLVFTHSISFCQEHPLQSLLFFHMSGDWTLFQKVLKTFSL